MAQCRLLCRVLVTGMMTAVFGDARDAHQFGIMGAITLTSALFADIFFLPALLSLSADPGCRSQFRELHAM